jgi:predicted XRE-type DNA-binding protein
MNKRMIDGVEVEMSSGNVFADLGLPNADKLKIKSGLVIEITKAVRNLGLSQEEAGRRMGLPQPKLSGLFRGDFSNVSERKLMDCLNRLGYDIEIKVKPSAEPVGQLLLAVA